MRKYLLILTTSVLALANAACSYDDDDIWNAVDEVTDRVDHLEQATTNLNTDLQALKTLVNALQNNITITSIVPGANGYTITFSDGTTATITNGQDGANAPVISVKKDSDGLYYWTVDGEWLIVDGEKVRASAVDGAPGADGQPGQPGTPGADAVAPQVRINPATGEWEISVDGGQVWTSTGITAQGANGDSLFKSVDASDPAYVVFVLSDGTEFKLPRYDATAPMFAIKDAEGQQVIRYGESKTYDVEVSNVVDYTIQRPDGWRVSYADGKLTITSPAKDNSYAEEEGTVAIVAVSENGKSMIAKVQVVAYELRVLTFEDADAKFNPYTLDYANASISTWSDLIDSKQYGGPLLYGTSGWGMDAPYYWYDQNNTELMHAMPEAWGMYCYWSGGHAVSNYASTDLSNGDHIHQLMVYGTEGAGGHNGSANFAMHFGYIDDSPYNMTSELPAIQFYDGVARTIDHMWVMNSVYAMNCYVNGNGLTANIGPDDWVKLVATGYDTNDQKVGEAYIYMCNGPEVIVRDWTKWDLSVLGDVVKVDFNVTGSSDNGAGFSQPAYFAYDDVAVKF